MNEPHLKDPFSLDSHGTDAPETPVSLPAERSLGDTATARIKEVIAKLEAAGEGSRDLDVEIGTMIGAADHSGPAWDRPYREWARWYTTSLDAALTLVPEGWEWTLSFFDNEPHGGLRHFRCAVQLMGAGRGVSGMRQTPALALCIAALKARVSLGTESHESRCEPGVSAESSKTDDGGKTKPFAPPMTRPVQFQDHELEIRDSGFRAVKKFTQIGANENPEYPRRSFWGRRKSTNAAEVFEHPRGNRIQSFKSIFIHG